MASILGSVRDALVPGVVEQAAGLVGENTTATRRGLEGAASSVLTGALSQASSPSGAERLLSMITGARYGTDTLSGLGRQLAGGPTTESFLASGSRLLSGLFGGQVDGVADAVAGAGGMGRSGATTLLRLAAPIVMGVLGTRVASGGLDAGGLSRLLTGERSSILSAAPAGLTSMLGLREPLSAAPAYEEAARVSNSREPLEPARERTGRSWWPAALAGLAALALLYFLSPGRQTQTARDDTVPRAERTPAPVAKTEPPPAPAPAPAPTTTTEPSAAPAASVREPATSSTPAPAASPATPVTGDALTPIKEFLTGAEPTPKTFTLSDVNFETGSARLTSSARQTLTALAGIMKTYPSARVKLEGHTDSAGDPAANKRLSEQRAAAVKSALVAAGASANSIEIAGLGAEQPVADNGTDAGRAQNRRTALVVLQR